LKYSKRDVVYQNFALIPVFVFLIGSTQVACAQSSDIQHISTEVSADSAVASPAAVSTITTDDIAQKINPFFDRLKEGKEERIILDLPRDASFRSGESLLLTIAYEPRPVGGILRMSANLIAAFSGIGNASRPIASKELAEAIDYLDLDDLAAKATDLIQQLRNEISVSAGGESTQINRAN
jgi:hypothetical protein